MTRQHAVVLPYPAQGHICPMMEFSEILASKGFTVTFVNTEFNHAKMVQSYSKNGCRPFQDQGLDIRLVGIPDGLPSDHGRTTDIPQLTKQTEATIKFEFEKLMDELVKQDPPVSCIISDVIMSWSDETNKKFKLPRIFFWTARTATFLIYHHIPLLKAKGYLPSSGKHSDELITCIPGVPPLQFSDLPSFLQDPADFMFDWMHRMVEPLNETDWVFVNSFYDLEQDAFETMSKTSCVLYPVGPLLPTAYIGSKDSSGDRKIVSLYEEDHNCLKWLDQQQPRSVLYVSFGSVAVLSAEQVKELALALESTGVPFLWVFRPDFVDGKAADPPEGFLERTAQRGVVTKWAPQLDVLSHKAVGGFLTHCGWNSTLETICMGVPVLGWPYFAEQKMNCRWMVDVLRIGLECERGGDGFVRRGVWVWGGG